MLIGHWKFNNSNIDSISNKSMTLNSLSYVSGVGSNDGASTSEASFSLSDFGISVLRDFSVSFWMKTSYPSSSAGGGSFSNWFIHFGGYYNNNSAGFGRQSGNVATYIKGSTSSGWSNSGSNATGTNIYDNNQGDWIHIVVCFKGNSRILFYMNDALIFDRTISDAFTGISSGIVTLGKSMNMDISDVRVYDRSSPERDINLLYHSPFSEKVREEVDRQLTLWYTFDDNSTTITDYSGNGYDTTLPTSAPTWTSNTNIGLGAFDFDGSGTIDGVTTGDYININESITDTRNYPRGCSYSFWINIDTNAVDRMSLFYGTSTRRHIEIYSSGKNFRTEAARQNGYSFGTGNFPNDVRGVWSHFVIVFANGESGRPVRWYQNGSLFYTKSMDSGDYPGTEYFSFNKIARSTGNTTYKYAKSFNGKMSDFRIYAKALTAGEVSSLTNRSEISLDKDGHAWCYSASSGSTTKLYKNGYLEYNSKFNRNIIWH